MTILLESPWPAIIIGGLATAIVASGWLQTGRQVLLVVMLAIIVLTIAAVAVERLVVTDGERVDLTLHEIARLVEQNDVNGVMQYAYSGRPVGRAKAAAELPHYKFQKVTIARNLEIKVDPKHIPPRATAEFNVIVKLGLADGSWNDQTVVRFVQITFYQETSGEWRVADYEHADPRRGLVDDNPRPAEAPQSWPRSK